ncbi:uncharacterized protein N7483_012900 [Penicillium malachiteum]|uniref:uncharacterized protein n=1 Tax=Penicillium malachiteum TaxID=1324776 RepID=UPI002547344E|nr:uncharacterized protein N7483_012900 [Penicillium malachiteum]KAJ5715719.1 hypothetical protein N7483_012900 [Penicillium malachiteum]
MKASFGTVMATLATSALAAPLLNSGALSGVTSLTNLGSLAGLTSLVGDLTQLEGVDGIADVLQLGDVTKELDLDNLPVVSSVGDLTSLLGVASTSDSSAPAVQDGHLVQDLGPQVQNVLTIVGTDLQPLLLELSPEVAELVSSLGLGALGVPLGSIVASASSLGDLVTGLGPQVDGLVIVVGADVGAVLVAALVSGLGLPTVGVPVGTILATVGTSLKKRGEIVNDLAPEVKEILTVTGPNAKQLLVKLSPEVAALVTGLGLPGVGVPVGEIIKTAGSVGDLLVDVSEPLDELLTVVGTDGKALLIQLSPEVALLVSGLGLTGTGVSVGSVIATIGSNL